MRALVLDRPREPLRLVERPRPEPGPGQVRLRVRACGVCRTDLHVVDGELPDPSCRSCPGHQIVGVVERGGPGSGRLRGRRSASACRGSAGPAARAGYCRGGRENLCAQARFTGLPPRRRLRRSTRSPTSASASRCPRATTTRTPRRCSAPG